jgi:hypothetical protein
MRLLKTRMSVRALKNLYPQAACFDIATYKGLRMPIPPMAQVCSGLLCGSLILIAGCGVLVVAKFGFFDRNRNAFDLKRRRCGRAEGSGASQ